MQKTYEYLRTQNQWETSRARRKEQFALALFLISMIGIFTGMLIVLFWGGK